MSERIRYFTLLTLFVSSLAFAGHRTGNGGDPLRLIFAKAKNDAELVVGSVDPARDFLVPSVAGALQERYQRAITFLAEPFGSYPTRQAAMEADIRASIHEWVYEEAAQPTCAWTNHEGDDTRVIRLSIPYCRTLLGEPDGGPAQAVRQLIHESAHHVGLVADEEEPFADDIGIFFYEAWEKKRDRTRPYWEAMPTVDSPDMRFLHSTVWSGANASDARFAQTLFIWGGCNYAILPNHEDCAHNLKSGAMLHFNDTARGAHWENIATESAPSERRNHVAVWTGNADSGTIRDRMLVFGGCRGQSDADMTCSNNLRDGGYYNPATKQWTTLADLPENMAPRVFSATAWTGREFIVWGGLSQFDMGSSFPSVPQSDGARLVFDDSTEHGRWVSLATTGAPPARFHFTSIASGRKLIFFGGCLQPGLLRCRKFANDLAVYDAAADEQGAAAWRVINAPASLQGRMSHSMVLVEGRYVIIWGGLTANGVASDGAIFDLESASWQTIPSLLPAEETGRFAHAAFWDQTHRRMVVWGGQYGNRDFSQTTMALQFSNDLTTYSWTALNTDVSPIGRKGADAVWTGQEFLVWGGFGDQFTFLDIGDILRLP